MSNEKKSVGRPKNLKDVFISMREPFNANALLYIINNETIFRPKLNPSYYKNNYDPFIQLTRYLNTSKNGIVKTKYKQNLGFGRFNALGSLSMQNMPRAIRHTIASDKYQDLDMSNAHPVILGSICNTRNINYKNLKYYINNRDAVLADISPDRDLAKKLILIVINGGTIKSPNEWLTKLIIEMKKIHAIFGGDAAFKDHKEQRITAEKFDNHEASYMNTLICDVENKILMYIYNQLDKPLDCVLCFDGLMVLNEVDIDTDMIEIMIEEEFNIDMKLVIKPMNEGFDIPGDIPIYIPKIINSFDFDDAYNYGDFFRSCSGRFDAEYEILDNYKKVIAHILSGEGCYVKKNYDGSFDVVKKLGSSDFSVVPMVWLSDFITRQGASFNSIACKLGDCPPDKFNVWSGFQSKPVVFDPGHIGFNLIKDFIFDIWASSDQESYNYIISWIAGLVTNLDGINRVALCMVSDQGTGKNTLTDFLKLVLRACNVVTLEGIEGVIGRFNSILQGKRLIVMNELCSTKDTFISNFDKIKPIITDATITIEPKGINKYEIDNISNLIAFTNHRDALSVTMDDRRWAVFPMANTYINDTAYFTNLRAESFNQETADQFYTYLLGFKAVDVTKIPSTAARNSMIEISKPNPIKFLDAIAEDEELRDRCCIVGGLVKAGTLYNNYKNWCSENGERNTLSNTKFGTTISTKLDKIHKRDGYYYQLQMN